MLSMGVGVGFSGGQVAHFVLHGDRINQHVDTGTTGIDGEMGGLVVAGVTLLKQRLQALRRLLSSSIENPSGS